MTICQNAFPNPAIIQQLSGEAPPAEEPPAPADRKNPACIFNTLGAIPPMGVGMIAPSIPTPPFSRGTSPSSCIGIAI
jgi:hypothetical protein